MSKRIVLKSVSVVVVLGFVLMFSSCQKEEKKIIGKWEYKKIEVRKLTTSNLAMNNAIRTMVPTAFPAVMQTVLGSDFDGITEFTKKGKVINGDFTATYKANETQLTITTNDGMSVTYDYLVPDDRKLYLDVDIIEMHNEIVDAFLEGMLRGAGLEITNLVIRLSFAKQK